MGQEFRTDEEFRAKLGKRLGVLDEVILGVGLGTDGVRWGKKRGRIGVYLGLK